MYVVVTAKYKAFLLKKSINIKRNILFNCFVVLLILVSIFIMKTFPVCYIDGYGLTKFKIYSDYAISLLFLCSIYLLNSNEEFALEKGKVEKEYSKYKKLIDFLPEGILIMEGSEISYANNKIASKLSLNDNNSIINRSIYELVDCDHKEKLINRLNIKNKKSVVNPVEGKLCYNCKDLDVEISTLFMKNSKMISLLTYHMN